MRVTNNETFLIKANMVHDNFYNYPEEYKGSSIKIIINCPIHGDFPQTPNDHLSGKGCKQCGFKHRAISHQYTDEEFKNKANLVHDGFYNYPEEYKGNKIKIMINCPIHGDFPQTPNNHLNGQKCKHCVNNNISYTNETFILKANVIHDDFYNYPNLNYINNKTTIKIECPIHGDFPQTPNDHLSGKGCPDCGGKKKLNTITFNNKANITHNNYYKYPYDYISYDKEILILCPIHGEFPQKPSNHLGGSGCSLCSESKGEKEIRKYLDKNNINYIPQKKFINCKYKRQLPFDFYLPDNNICIEFDGEQHYKIIEYFGGKIGFDNRQKYNKIKTDYCKNNNITLLRIKYNDNIETILNTIK